MQAVEGRLIVFCPASRAWVAATPGGMACSYAASSAAKSVVPGGLRLIFSRW